MNSDIRGSRRRLPIFLALGLISSYGNTTPEFSYPGIPYPTETLPEMLHFPQPDENQQISATPDSVSGWPYDPLKLTVPVPTGAPNEYVISFDGIDAGAGNDNRGTLEAPRRTIPEGPFGAGTKFFIIGDGSAYTPAGAQFDMGDKSNVTFQCEEADPCWWIGINQPRIGRRINFLNSSHLLIDSIQIVDTQDGSRPWGQISIENSEYISIRNSEVRGSGANSGRGGSLLQMKDTRYLVTYQSKIHTAGDWECNRKVETCKDVHGWRPLYGNEYLWLIDSELFHLQGDGVQLGNSNNKKPSNQVSRFVYIAGNTFYENYENALDNKNSYHVIFSSNDAHSFWTSDGKNANSTAAILSNNSEGPFSSHHWAINNRIWNTGTAIRDSGTTHGEINFIVGNVAWDINSAFKQANNGEEREAWIIHNTVYQPRDLVVQVRQPGIDASAFIRNNVFVGGSMGVQDNTYVELTGNLLETVSINYNDVDFFDNNVEAAAQLTDPENIDFTLAETSPAINLIAEEDSVFELFRNLYGLDLSIFIFGPPDQTQMGYDAGAL